MRIFLWLAFLAAGCSQIQSEKYVIREYFNLDSLINEQIKYFSSRNVEIEKTASIDNEEEYQKFRLDSAEWEKEFVFFRNLNLNVSKLAGSYEKVINEKGYSYSPVDASKVNVKYLEFEFRNQSLISISGKIREENEIYSSFKDIKVQFKDDLIESYKLEGYQKVILKDTTKFKIEGKINNL